jgi:hypothetical protein
MLSFKQYLREAMVNIPGKGNVLARPTTKSEPTEPIAVEGIPTPSTQDRRASKLSALIGGRKADMAAQASQQRGADVERGAGILNKFLGSREPVKDAKGKVIGSEVRGGFVGALKAYDQYRAKQGIAVNRRGTIDPNTLRNLGVQARNRMTADPTASGPNLLRTLGTAARIGSNVKTGVSNTVSNIGTDLQNNSNNLANSAVSGTDPLNPEDKNAAMLQAAKSSKLNAGQAAQTVGMQTTQTRQSGENTADAQTRMSQPQGTSSFETQLNQQRNLESPAPLSRSYGSSAEIAKKQADELEKRMSQIGNRPGFAKTRATYSGTKALNATLAPTSSSTQQRMSSLGAGSMYEEIMKIVNRDHR